MARFKPKSMIVLRREIRTSRWWRIKGKFPSFDGLYQGWQKIYGTMEDKERITEIRIEVTREK